MFEYLKGLSLEMFRHNRERNIQIYTENESYVEDELLSETEDAVYKSIIYSNQTFKLRPIKRSICYSGFINAPALSLARHYPDSKTMILNFASAIHPGGGYIRGANAQEECLCRSSNLYNILKRIPSYYQYNKSLPGTLYSDWMIYTPKVIFFRDDYFNKLSTPFKCAVLTAAAPNNRTIGVSEELLYKIFRERILKVFNIAQAHKREHVILGAWGCGAFCNNPEIVALAFKQIMDMKCWNFSTDFAILDTPDQKLLTTFRDIIKG